MITILFDTETTGLLKPEANDMGKQPYITDIFCLKVQHDINGIEILEQFESLVKPPIPLSAEITKITGLTDADLADQPTFYQIWEELAEFFTGVDRLVAHNLAFDRSMLANELHRSGKVINFPWPREHICTVEKTMQFEQRRLSLQKLHNYLFKRDFKDAHRARPDVMAMFDCYSELLDRGVITR